MKKSILCGWISPMITDGTGCQTEYSSFIDDEAFKILTVKADS